MKRVIACIVAITAFTLGSAAYAIWEMSNAGAWPDSWPKELEPLRKQSRTIAGRLANGENHLIPFTRRGEFEAAWPHILKIKSKNAPVILMRGPYKSLGGTVINAGSVIHSPPRSIHKRSNPEEPLLGNWAANERGRWINTTYIELVVDGLVVDLNRIQLPPDTPIIDERFNSDKEGSTKKLPEPRDRPNDD